MTDDQAGMALEYSTLESEHWPDGARAAFRLRCQGTRYDGKPIPVTGLAFLPAGDPPADGWPIIAYCHGTTGLGDSRAPSRVGLSPAETITLSHWLAAGFAIAASDYEGVGTEEEHPFLHAASITDDVVDVVRAVRELEPSCGRRWLGLGFSQGGHAALCVGAVAAEYAPDLEHLGTIALAPPSLATQLVQALLADPDGPVSAVVPMILAGLSIAIPSFEARHYLPDDADRLLDQVQGGTLQDVYSVTAGYRNRDLGLHALLDNMEVRNALWQTEIPLRRFPQPILLAHGTADKVVPYGLSEALAALLRIAGCHVDHESCPGVDHLGILRATRKHAIAWATQKITDVRA